MEPVGLGTGLAQEGRRPGVYRVGDEKRFAALASAPEGGAETMAETDEFPRSVEESLK